MYVYIYVYIYMCIYMYTYAYTYIHIHTYIYISATRLGARDCKLPKAGLLPAVLQGRPPSGSPPED